MKREEPSSSSFHFPKAITHKLTTENNRIYQENKSNFSAIVELLERLTNLRPTIDNKKLLEERKKQLNILKFIGKYTPNGTSFDQMNMLRISQKIGRISEEDTRNMRYKT